MTRRRRAAATAPAPSGGTPGTAWFEDDAAWARFEPVLFTPDRLAAAPHEAAQVEALLGLGRGDRVLDLCCGVGRHALELARRGYEMVAVDRTRGFLARLRERRDLERLPIEVVCQRMDRFRRPGAFAAALSLYTSFGYHDDPEQDRATLANVRASLRPGGRLLMQLLGRDQVLTRFRARATWRLDGDRHVIEETALIDDGRRTSNCWTLVDGSGRHAFRFRLTLYSADELERLLRACGFAGVTLYGDLDGHPYGAEAAQLVAVATRE